MYQVKPKGNIMNYSERKISPVAQEIFEKYFVPYIVNEFKSVARISYLSDEEARQNWRSAYGFNPAIATHLLREAGMFYVLHFSRNEECVTDINILHDLATLMSRYMLPYFMKSGLFETEEDVFNMLKQRLYFKNRFVNRQFSRIKKHNKRERKKEEMNQLIQAKAFVEFLDILVELCNAVKEPAKRKRAHFIRDKVDINEFVESQKNKKHSIEKSTKEFVRLERDIAEFKARKRKQNKK